MKMMPSFMSQLFGLRCGSPGAGFIGDPVQPLVGNLGFIFLNHIFPHFILMQPDWISISPDEVINIHSINGGRTLHSFLLTVNKNSHVFLLSSLSLGLFGRCQFAFGFCHGRLCSFHFPMAASWAAPLICSEHALDPRRRPLQRIVRQAGASAITPALPT
jgi:hypothetical protein